MFRQLFTHLAGRVQLQITRFGIKEWILLIYFFVQPLIWQQCIDGFDYAWHLLQIASLFATADIAEHLIGIFQGQVESQQLLTRIKEWGLIISAAAFLILLVESVVIGL
ncbi:hypothetical protein [Larkinella punicea]|uniref:Uncharacterized protein n=1 Tax=Larkinella punicea TaxID=2315727 RepID=A0A368JIE9_9BACT|nr:hypothetical protein [Larkinella punicea]RCR67438.1 hypothetical protein DUE52_21795 [Larkinella punicea]